MAKAGPPMNGKDLHVGDFASGVLPAAAPLTIGTTDDRRDGAGVRARGQTAASRSSFIGEGGSSLGEWHEAINLCAARRLPAIFCVQNNQTALSTPVADQSAVRVFADKAAGYGMPGITIDGTDPDEIAAAFAWAAERAREGKGPALIELVCMRMCGHAHHDDMLYLGRDPQPSWTYPPLTDQGYANRELYAYWSARDPLPTYAARLVAEGVIQPGDLERIEERGRGAGRARGARGDRRAMAGRRRTPARGCSPASRRGRGSRCSTRRCAARSTTTPACRRSSPTRRAIRKAARFSTP